MGLLLTKNVLLGVDPGNMYLVPLRKRQDEGFLKF